MLRRSLLALAATAALLTPVCGQEGGLAKSADKEQLDRIERKLDELLRRMNPAGVPSPIPGRAGASGGTASAAQPAEVAAYRPGAVAVVHAAPADTRSLEEIPANSVGGFVYTGGTIALHDLASRGVRYTGLGSVELQGWLRTTQTGRYQISADLRATLDPSTIITPDCLTLLSSATREVL